MVPAPARWGGGLRRKGVHLFEKIISLENLFLAWHEFRKGKRAKVDVQEFEFNLEDNIFALHEELVNKTYNHGRYTPFYITDPKLRHIHKACVRDRILHQAIFRTLYPIFDKSFIYDSYSCRLKKGTHRAVLQLESFAQKASQNNIRVAWALKCDISKFFDSIDQRVLQGLIQRKISDPELLWLLEKILSSFEKQHGKGIPLGNVTSQLFSNIYLNELDQFVKHALKQKYYLRYCDDFIMLSESKVELERLIPKIQEFLQNNLMLTLHPRKICLRKLSQGIDFLGYVALPHHRVLRTRTKRRMFKKIERRLIEHKNKGISKQAIERMVQSYIGILSHCDGKKEKEELENMVSYTGE